MCNKTRQTPVEEQYLFSKEEMDAMIHWEPVSNIPVEEIYENLPEVKKFHDNFVKMWLNKEKTL